MCKFKMKLLYIEQKLFCAKIEWFNFKTTLPLAKLNMNASRLEASSLNFLMDAVVNTQLANVLVRSNISELNIGVKNLKKVL